ncbi:hypothetical protein HHL21_12230 [Massilia sp. RP-1-19]|uniref:Phage gp6-like head-tail connector protein n=1 Tax=Massilia polaris TaxID=2728846 RepID=A0A848HT22_9BURK|nr:hypothetical protein [Massilia polaris]NML61828.1 hypothetical protein [Massilia polaris]
MTSEVIVEPVEMAVSLTSARNAARVNGTDHDEAIEIEVRALMIEAEHYTGHALITQTHEITLDRFPKADMGNGPGSIRMPLAQLQSVTSVKYFDLDNIEQTLDPADYTIDRKSKPGYIVPAPNVTWPATYCRINAVSVVAVHGYGDTAASVPDGFKSFILGRIQEHFATPGTAPSPYLIGKIHPYKVYG